MSPAHAATATATVTATAAAAAAAAVERRRWSPPPTAPPTPPSLASPRPMLPLLLLLLLLLLLPPACAAALSSSVGGIAFFAAAVSAGESGGGDGPGTPGGGGSGGGGGGGGGGDAGGPERRPPPPPAADDDDEPEKNWGTFYDPQSVFCGDYDCYKILGFDHETWGDAPPDGKLITRSYRQLSRRWHPDKNRGKRAKERFVKINRAYEVLTDEKKRAEYDYLRDRPDEYFLKYGSNIIYRYAPKSDATFIVILFLAAGSAFTWMVQRQKWHSVADRLVRASVEGWGPKEGGTAESLDIRERALERLSERRKEREETERGGSADCNSGNATATATAVSPRKKERLTNKEKRQRDQDELRPIVAEIVREEMLDFGGGFHQPTWRDLLVVKLVKLPPALLRTALWQTFYWLRRLRGLELSNDEREVLTRRAVGEVAWHAASEEDREEMVKRDLWVTKNLEDWREWQEVKKLGPGYQKRYGRWKKKQGSKLE